MRKEGRARQGAFRDRAARGELPEAGVAPEQQPRALPRAKNRAAGSAARDLVILDVGEMDRRPAFLVIAQVERGLRQKDRRAVEIVGHG